MNPNAAGAMPRTNRVTEAGTGIEVNALATIGRDQHLLVLRQRGHLRCFLPGVAVMSGVPAENALRRALQDDLGASVTFLSFLAAVEHGYADQFGTAHHELNLVFDAGLAEAPQERTDRDLELRWVPSADLATTELGPPGLRDGLLSGRFDEGDRWLPWRHGSGHQR